MFTCPYYFCIGLSNNTILIGDCSDEGPSTDLDYSSVIMFAEISDSSHTSENF